jgi:hypothetical protein
MTTDFLVMAAHMLGGDDFRVFNLHKDLRLELVNIDALCRKQNGVLRSRQVIATAIVNWQKRNPKKKAYRE